MPTPYPEQINPATFFSRERRRQRMRLFLDAFERGSRRFLPDSPFLTSVPEERTPEPASVDSDAPRP